MKRILALVLGLGLIVAAFGIAASASSGDRAQRPEARAFATELHRTPVPTATPEVAPTPLHLTDPVPTVQEVARLLFQYRVDGAEIDTAQANIRMELVPTGVSSRTLAVAGDGAAAGKNGTNSSAAFGAVLTWEDGEYRVRYRHVETANRNVSVSLSVPEADKVVILFDDWSTGFGGEGEEFRRMMLLEPCKSWQGLAGLQVREQSNPNVIELQCY